ncbi:hypothetical protein AC579_6594 [Pseudocercospora musae]|uniref:Uncharacterized protein n=1 Tax=Pseudocercospora musae TaxID=113226 RepID=A0A139IGC2_9PEZI|nr:hypothetical protein AC579_6594 [Pseudocercospora musae]
MAFHEGRTKREEDSQFVSYAMNGLRPASRSENGGRKSILMSPLRYPSRNASMPRIRPPAQQKVFSPSRACSHICADGNDLAQFFSSCTVAFPCESSIDKS